MDWHRYRTIPWEVLAIGVLSQLPYLLSEYVQRAQTPEAQLVSTYWSGVAARYTIVDIFGYATGVLGSAMVFFILRYRMLGKHTRMILTGIVLPLVVIAVSSLLPTADVVSNNKPNSFVSGFAWIVFFILIISWVIALFEQRNLEATSYDVEGEVARRSMAKAARKSIG